MPVSSWSVSEVPFQQCHQKNLMKYGSEACSSLALPVGRITPFHYDFFHYFCLKMWNCSDIYASYMLYISWLCFFL